MHLEILEDRVLLSSAPVALKRAPARTTPPTISATKTVPAPAIFDQAYYLAKYPDVAAAVNRGATTAWNHFRLYGQFEGRDPSAFFNAQYYLAHNADIAAALAKKQITSAFDHFTQYGMHEGRTASSNFSESYYLATYADVAAAVRAGAFNSGLQHYLVCGKAEGRNATPPILNINSGDATLHLPANGSVQLTATGQLGGLFQTAGGITTTHFGGITTAINPEGSTSSSVLDLTNNRLLLQTTDTASKAAAILALNEAIWANRSTMFTGTNGITSSTGDTNLDGIVNIADLVNVTPAASYGDLNSDGIINFADLALIANTWNQPTTSFNLNDYPPTNISPA